MQGHFDLVGLVYRLTGSEPVGVYILQMVLGVVTLFLVYRVAGRAYDPIVGLASAAIAASAI